MKSEVKYRTNIILIGGITNVVDSSVNITKHIADKKHTCVIDHKKVFNMFNDAIKFKFSSSTTVNIGIVFDQVVFVITASNVEKNVIKHYFDSSLQLMSFYGKREFISIISFLETNLSSDVYFLLNKCYFDTNVKFYM